MGNCLEQPGLQISCIFIAIDAFSVQINKFFDTALCMNRAARQPCDVEIPRSLHWEKNRVTEAAGSSLLHNDT